MRGLLYAVGLWLWATSAGWAYPVVVLKDAYEDLKPGTHLLVLQESAEELLVFRPRPWLTTQRVPRTYLKPSELKAVGVALGVDPQPPTNLRRSPDGPILTRVQDGQVYLLLSRPAGSPWWEVVLGDGTRGFVHESVLAPLALEQTPQVEADLKAIVALVGEHWSHLNRGRELELQIYMGPLGSVRLDQTGEVTLWERDVKPFHGALAGGLAGDWAMVETLEENRLPHGTDAEHEACLLHKQNGRYQMVAYNVMFSKEELRRLQVPDQVIKLLQVPVSR